MEPLSVPSVVEEKRAALEALMPDYAALKSKHEQRINQVSQYNLSMRHLVNAGVHMGHSTENWHVNMLPYIYGRRAGIHIINLEHTFVHLRRAMNVTREIARRGGTILFVGIRPFQRDILVKAAKHSNQFYVHQRWLRGCLTNHQHTLKKSSNGVMLQPDLIVVLDMNECPDVLEEAAIMNVPTIGIADTDCDPMLVTYPIPANDDSTSSVELVTMMLAECAKEGLSQYDALEKSIKVDNAKK